MAQIQLLKIYTVCTDRNDYYICMYAFTSILLYLHSSSYFVEYLFPLPSAHNDSGKAIPVEVTRVVSNKVLGGGECFFSSSFLFF